MDSKNSSSKSASVPLIDRSIDFENCFQTVVHVRKLGQTCPEDRFQQFNREWRTSRPADGVEGRRTERQQRNGRLPGVSVALGQCAEQVEVSRPTQRVTNHLSVFLQKRLDGDVGRVGCDHNRQEQTLPGLGSRLAGSARVQADQRFDGQETGKQLFSSVFCSQRLFLFSRLFNRPLSF